MVGSKTLFVGTVHNINFQKTIFCINTKNSKNIFFKIPLLKHVHRHRFKKINVTFFGKFTQKILGFEKNF